MATISFANQGACGGGGHRTLGVSFNGGAVQSFTYPVEDLRAPLSALTQEDRAAVALAVIKIHFAGKTPAQIAAELATGPVVVTI